MRTSPEQQLVKAIFGEDTRMRIRVKLPHQSLCGSCAHSQITIDRRGRAAVYCNQIGERVSTTVTDCTNHRDRTQPSQYDMEKTAWIIDMKGGRVVGFVRPGTPEHEKLTKD